MNPLKPHQERVVYEKEELDKKREKLKEFINGEVFKTLEQAEQFRLSAQIEIMTQYSNVLDDRINAFVS